nr:glycosyltransferase [uncultured Psychroserpens sp.]
MIVYYFGADSPWQKQTEKDIRRRNMAVLLSIAKQPEVTLVYNVIRCTRDLLLNKTLQKQSSNLKIQNLYIGAILPERSLIKVLTRPLNKLILKLLNPKKLISKNTLSWCYWPKAYEDYKFLGLNNRMVFDTDHNIIEDPNLKSSQKDKREKLLLLAGKDAELVLSSSRSMLDWYDQRGFVNLKIMMNGVFKSRIAISNLNNDANNKFTVTYCGTLSKWVKVDWLIKMAQDQPDWIINIIGKNYETTINSKLEGFSNIKLHGFLEPKHVDVVLQETNVCIGLYREEEALDVNSMKIYDYLAQGKPIVVNNYHANIGNDFNNLVEVANDYENFIKSLKQAKAIDTDNLKQFLNDATWYNRVQSIIQAL